MPPKKKKKGGGKKKVKAGDETPGATVFRTPVVLPPIATAKDQTLHYAVAV
jgi:hypothetical protein